MSIVAVYPDAVAGTITALRALLAARSEPYAAGVTFGTKVPGDRSTETPSLPFALVALDASQPTYPITTRSAIRVTVWHANAGDAIDLAQLCHGLLLSHTDATLAAVYPVSGPVPGVDDVSQVDLATFTVTVTTCATVLS